MTVSERAKNSTEKFVFNGFEEGQILKKVLI